MRIKTADSAYASILSTYAKCVETLHFSQFKFMMVEASVNDARITQDSLLIRKRHL